MPSRARSPPPAPPIPARSLAWSCRCGRPPSKTPAPSAAAGTCPPPPPTRPRLLPAIAATAIARYTKPGDLVADPMCGIGTTLVEALHLDRHGIGVEYDNRWAAIAAANITHACRQGATGTAEVIGDDARHLPAVWAQRARPGPRRAALGRRSGRKVRQPLQPRPRQPGPPRPR